MTLDLDAAGVRRRIEARRRDGRWEITLDGRQLDANLVAANGRWSLLVAEAAARSGPAAGDAEGAGSTHAGPDDEVPGGSRAYRSYEVAADGQHVYVNGRAIAVTVDDPRAPRARAGRRLDSDSGSGRVAAPMPGRIVKVLVTAGDAVTAGQPLLVMEAMKMENEIRAPKAGTVADLRVAEGASVDAHAVLLLLE